MGLLDGLFGSKNQTTTNTSTPWGPAQEPLKLGLTDAMKVYQSGVGSQPYTGSTVVPYSTQTIQGMNQLQAGANSALPMFNQNLNRINAQAGNGGLNNLQDAQIANLQPFANGNPTQGTSQLNNAQLQSLRGYQGMMNAPIAEGLGQLNNVQRQSLTGYQGMANAPIKEGTAQFNDAQRRAYQLQSAIAGGSEMNGNPYLQDVIDRSTRDIMGASNLNASAAGRYGSGSHQGVTERNVGDMASGLRFTDYNNQLGRKDAAIRDVFGMGNQANAQTEADYGRRQFGLQGINQLGNQANTQTEADYARRQFGIQGVNQLGNQANSQYEADMGRKMDAIGSLFNAGQQQQQNVINNTDALADAYGLTQAPSQTLQDVGGQYEDLYGRNLNDRLRIFNEQQNQPWNQIARLNAVASGAGQMGGNTTATAQGPSRLSSGLGGALGGYSMLGPLGALGGGLLGLLQ